MKDDFGHLWAAEAAPPLLIGIEKRQRSCRSPK